MNAPSAVTSPPERILVRGVNWLGDAVMTTPALRRLRETFPSAHITLLSPVKLSGLWLVHPSIDAVLVFGEGESPWQVAGRLRSERFQIGVALPNSARSALELWLARIPRRVGYGGGGRGWLLTQSVSPRPGAVRMRKRSVAEIRQLAGGAAGEGTFTPHPADHHIHHYLHLLAALGCDPKPMAPELYVTGEEMETARQKFGLTGDGRPWFGLNAGAEYGPAKRWPAERFVAAAVELQRRTRCRWLLFGRGAELELTAGMAAQIQSTAQRADPAETHSVLNLAGKTSLRELCALLKVCRVLLTNDTGPMHVAAALGTPVVVPFGSTSPELTGPGLPGDSSHRLLKAAAPCAPCFLRECPIDFRCMNSLGVNRVVRAVMEVAGT